MTNEEKFEKALGEYTVNAFKASSRIPKQFTKTASRIQHEMQKAVLKDFILEKAGLKKRSKR